MEMSPLFLVALLIQPISSVTLVKEQQLYVKVSLVLYTEVTNLVFSNK